MTEFNVQDVNLRKLYCKRMVMSRKRGASEMEKGE